MTVGGREDQVRGRKEEEGGERGVGSQGGGKEE